MAGNGHSKLRDLLSFLSQHINLSLNDTHIFQADDNTTFENCMRYSVNWSAILHSDKPIEVNKSWPMEPCLDGYEYDTSEVISSIVIDVSNCNYNFVTFPHNYHCLSFSHTLQCTCTFH